MSLLEDQSDTPTKLPAAPTDEFVQLFTKWQRRLFLFILSQFPIAADAEEILQETNLVIWRKWYQYRAGTNFYAWCCRIAVLEVFKYRERSRRSVIHLSDRFIEIIARDAEESADTLEGHRRALMDCLERLTTADRELIRHRYGPGQTGKSVAEALGRPTNSVYQSLSRIRRMLFQCVKRRMAAEAYP